VLLARAGLCWAQDAEGSQAPVPPTETFPTPHDFRATPVSAKESVSPQKQKNSPKDPKLEFLLLSGLAYAAAGMDMHDTVDSINRCKHYHCVGDAEGDPVARPFTHLPTPAYYVSGYALVTGVNWLGWKLGKSARGRKVWWLPQTIAISLNTQGVYSHHH
jgi:hypothetical protein